MILTRGDTGRYKFSRKNAAGEVIMERPETMFFTVKDSYETSGVIFQKSLSDMSMDGEGVLRLNRPIRNVSQSKPMCGISKLRLTDMSRPLQKAN